MKRAFLFGLGSFLILVIIGLLVRHDTPSVIMALVLMLVSVIAIRAAVARRFRMVARFRSIQVAPEK